MLDSLNHQSPLCDSGTQHEEIFPAVVLGIKIHNASQVYLFLCMTIGQPQNIYRGNLVDRTTPHDFDELLSEMYRDKPTSTRHVRPATLFVPGTPSSPELWPTVPRSSHYSHKVFHVSAVDQHEYTSNTSEASSIEDKPHVFQIQPFTQHKPAVLNSIRHYLQSSPQDLAVRYYLRILNPRILSNLPDLSRCCAGGLLRG